MVLGLIPNIGNRRVNAGNTDAERPVSLLPFEWMQLGKCFVNPFGRIAFEKLQRLGKRQRCWQRNQYVHVIRDASDSERFYLIFSCNTAEIRPKALA